MCLSFQRQIKEHEERTIRPNFFIVGAPRCGTIALSQYLAEHPEICFSRPKESQFFATDMPNIRQAQTERDYLSKFFGHCSDRKYKTVGEGSVWHLYSQEAIPNILSFDSNARFIIMVRNPVNLCVSLYMKLSEMLYEDRNSFFEAWALQERRARGECIPPHCRDVKTLLYAEVAKLGCQVRRAFNLIPPKQRLVIVFEDFTRNTGEIYRRVLDFLKVPDDGRTVFPSVNESRRVMNRRLWELAVSPPRILTVCGAKTQKVLGGKKLNILPKVHHLFLILMGKLLLVRGGKPIVSQELKKEMIAEFSDDIDLLSNLLCRDLSCWKKV